MKVQRIFEAVQTWGTYAGAPTSMVEFASDKKELPSVAAPYVLGKLLEINPQPRYVGLVGNDPAKESVNDMEALLSSLMSWVGSRNLARVILQTHGECATLALVTKYRQLLSMNVVVDCTKPLVVLRSAFERLSAVDRMIFLCASADVPDEAPLGIMEEMSKMHTCNPVIEIRVRDVSSGRVVTSWRNFRRRFDIRVMVDPIGDMPLRRSKPAGAA